MEASSTGFPGDEQYGGFYTGVPRSLTGHSESTTDNDHAVLISSPPNCLQGVPSNQHSGIMNNACKVDPGNITPNNTEVVEGNVVCGNDNKDKWRFFPLTRSSSEESCYFSARGSMKIDDCDVATMRKMLTSIDGMFDEITALQLKLSQPLSSHHHSSYNLDLTTNASKSEFMELKTEQKRRDSGSRFKRPDSPKSAIGNFNRNFQINQPEENTAARSQTSGQSFSAPRRNIPAKSKSSTFSHTATKIFSWTKKEITELPRRRKAQRPHVRAAKVVREKSDTLLSISLDVLPIARTIDYNTFLEYINSPKQDD